MLENLRRLFASLQDSDPSAARKNYLLVLDSLPEALKSGSPHDLVDHLDFFITNIESMNKMTKGIVLGLLLGSGYTGNEHGSEHEKPLLQWVVGRVINDLLTEAEAETQKPDPVTMDAISRWKRDNPRDAVRELHP